MGINVQNLVTIWKGPFADKYSDKPRFCRLLREAELDFIESDTDEDSGMLYVIMYVIMYVMNSTQMRWIEDNVLLDMEETFARMTGLELLSIGIDIMKNEDAFVPFPVSRTDLN